MRFMDRIKRATGLAYGPDTKPAIKYNPELQAQAEALSRPVETPPWFRHFTLGIKHHHGKATYRLHLPNAVGKPLHLTLHCKPGSQAERVMQTLEVALEDLNKMDRARHE